MCAQHPFKGHHHISEHINDIKYKFYIVHRDTENDIYVNFHRVISIVRALGH